MNDIKLLQDLFYVSLTMAAIGLGLSIFFFFYFDIREIYMIRSGKDRQNAVEDMTQRSARNGRLRRMNKQPKAQAAKPEAPAAAYAPTAPVAAMMDTMPLNQANTGYSEPAAEETTCLHEQAETAPIQDMTERFDADTTELLSNRKEERTAAAGGFVLTENTILIHTNEII